MYSVERNERFGRYLVAKDDIRAGEIILREKPSVVGPKMSRCSPVCVACHRPPPKALVVCELCKFAPLCGAPCRTPTGWHTERECRLFSKLQKPPSPAELTRSPYLMTVMRCIALRETDDGLWNRFVDMESHTEARRNSDIWKLHQFKTKVLHDCDILTEEDRQNELVQKICGVLDVNSFELRVDSDTPVEPVCGIYILAALMAHNCTPNVHLAIDNRLDMTVRAAVDIPEGQPIYFNYTHALQGTVNRREHLLEGKYFKCVCKRCTSGTELGTHISTLKCPKCKKDALISNPSSDLSSTEIGKWQCDECGEKFSQLKIDKILDSVNKVYDNIDLSEPDSIEKFLAFAVQKLHPNHYIILEAKQTLAGILRDVLERSIQQSKKLLLRKIEICNDFLQIFDSIEPGISRLKAITLYEIHIPIAVLANKDHDAREISSCELLSRLTDAKIKLKEAIRLLLFEPMNSPEGSLCRRAMNDLKMLQRAIDETQNMIEKEIEAEKQGRRKNRKR